MTNLPDDLLMRTVVYNGDIDDMGVVVEDLRDKNVKVKFATTGEEWVPRGALEDVTELYDYAYEWGLTDEKQSDN